MARERIWSLSWGSPVAGCRNAMATSDGKHEISHSTRVKSWQGFYLVHEWRWSPSLYRVWTVNNSMCKMNLQYAKSNKLYSVPESPYDTEANLYARCILALYTQPAPLLLLWRGTLGFKSRSHVIQSSGTQITSSNHATFPTDIPN